MSRPPHGKGTLPYRGWESGGVTAIGDAPASESREQNRVDWPKVRHPIGCNLVRTVLLKRQNPGYQSTDPARVQGHGLSMFTIEDRGKIGG